MISESNSKCQCNVSARGSVKTANTLDNAQTVRGRWRNLIANANVEKLLSIR